MPSIIKSACPRCQSRGHDTSGDNLITFHDGGAFCFKCHYTIRNNDYSHYIENPAPKKQTISLPGDADIGYSAHALDWIGKYQLSKSDLLHNGVLFSTEYNQLIFPFWHDGVLIAYQARCFSKNAKSKWFTKGFIQTVNNIFFLGKRVGHGNVKGNALFLVEDIISAIKLSKLGKYTMPLFGVNIKIKLALIRVLRPLETIIFLDEDQHMHSVKESLRIRSEGFKCHSILSEKDPKEYTYEELEILTRRN